MSVTVIILPSKIVEVVRSNQTAPTVVTNGGTVNYYFTEIEIVGEIPTGNINGSNAIFQSAFDFDPATVKVYLNGLRQKIVDDYNLIGTREILLTNSPNTNEILLMDYIKS